MIVLTTLFIAILSAGGAFVESLLGRALLPSQSLVQQYGHAEVYVAATHILRPYVEFDFPTGLGAYLAVGCMFAVSLYMCQKRWWAVGAASICALHLC